MIDVIVPVFAGQQETKKCLESLFQSCCDTEFEIIVIDDCSPEPALSQWLEEQAAAGHLTLLKHAHNRGFVAAVNTGIEQHPERDFVLLNSDTEVANDWLDRIVACAASDPKIGTVTPFSNNATICSYPFEAWEGGVPGGLGLVGLDRLFGTVLSGRVIDLPTAIGFCMFIRRACHAVVGKFDEAAFGRGYGEENDFSLRAAKAGWRNVLAADVFVYHRGAVSFGAGRFELMRQAERALLARHPDYNERVRAFVGADPLAPLRDAIDRARVALGAEEARAVLSERDQERTRLRDALRASARTGPRAPAAASSAGNTAAPATERVGVQPLGRFIGARPEHLAPPAHAAERPVLLHLGHGWGGGIERWIQDYAAADDSHWNLMLRSRTWRNAAGVRLELVDLHADDELLLAWELSPEIVDCAIGHTGYRQILDEVVDQFGVQAVVISSLIGHALDACDSGLPTALVLHDLFPFCPALFGWFDGACGRCDRDDLSRCLAGNPLNVFWYHDDPDHWLALREAFAARLGRPELRIAAPGDSIHARYARLFPVLRDRPWRCIPHGLGGQAGVAASVATERVGSATESRRLRILIPARLAPHKGLELFNAMLPELAGFAEILLLGCGDFGRPFEQCPHVEVVEDYANETLAERVLAFAPDCALLLSTLPESFSYTLSEMSALAVPVVATRLGAFAERIRDGETGFLVEPEPASVLQRLRELAADRAPLQAVAATLRGSPVRSAAEMVGDYQALLGLDVPATARPRPGMLARAAVHEAAVRRFLREQNGQLHAQVGALEAHLRLVDGQLLWAESRATAQEVRAEAERRRANAQEARADAQQQRADALDQREAHITARADELQQALAALHAEAQQLGLRLRSLESERDALLASSSWRLTAPLRKVTKLLRGPTLESAAEQQPLAGSAAVDAVPVVPAVAPAAVPPSPPVQPDAPAGDDTAIAVPTGLPPTAPAELEPKPEQSPGCDECAVDAAVGPAVAEVIAPPVDESPLLAADCVARVGDIMAWTRAHWLEQALAPPAVDDRVQAPAAPVPPGFAVVLRAAGRAGQRPTLACFEGLDDKPGAAATALCAELDTVFVASAALAQQFTATWPQAQARLKVIRPPLLGDWGSSAERAAVRVAQREKIGLPDRARIILGIGAVESRSGLDHFAQLASQSCAQRNDLRFVWLGARDDEWERRHARELGIPLALRQLFILPDRHFVDWLLAADGYLGCRAASVQDPGALEALAAGLPVCLASRSSLPDGVPDSDRLHQAGGDEALAWLLARGKASPDAIADAAFLASMDDAATRAAFLTACRTVLANPTAPVSDHRTTGA